MPCKRFHKAVWEVTMHAPATSRLESHAFACLSFGVIGDAMGTPTENLEPAQIEEKFGWVDSGGWY